MGNKKIIFYVWVLPLLWVPCTLVQYSFPGDEYAMYAVSSIPGLWIGLFGNYADIHNLATPVSIAFGGAITVAVVGLLMDWMRVSVKRWVYFFVTVLGILFAIAVIQCVLNKTFWNAEELKGFAILFVALSLYLSVFVSILSKGVGFLINMINKGNARQRRRIERKGVMNKKSVIYIVFLVLIIFITASVMMHNLRPEKPVKPGGQEFVEVPPKEKGIPQASQKEQHPEFSGRTQAGRLRKEGQAKIIAERDLTRRYKKTSTNQTELSRRKLRELKRVEQTEFATKRTRMKKEAEKTDDGQQPESAAE